MTTSNEHNNAPAVPQGEPVAWMVHGNYTRQPFGMLSSAEAYMRGLLKSDPDGGYHIRPLYYTTTAPAPAQCEPFGHFRAEPFGWTDCAEDDEGAIALYERPQEVGLTDDQADAVSMALRRAWQLGQTYWQQADSDYISQHKKSEETQRKFEKLCDDTIAALRAKGGKL